ncbi:acetyl-CoA C-acyltransferase [Mycolicibacterium sp. HK-90]|uniref:acetyl-CoA C-acyltransferase n=1 Tax=Mycolicibacterium sp. HK-90 TaxID=3056937 RepID=UPI002658B28E|nr:acetyl-CoA C-acyltransferase [Mycolicibacterium sp. HK-90]WKG03976.1 acetyl-CoA C-acyltransferase [Mycolicibacterium sp. HK-90]
MTSNNDAVLVGAVRTHVAKFGGAFADLSAVDLGAAAIGAALERVGGQLVPEQIFMGNVVQAGNGQNPARLAAIRAGLPTTIPGVTFNDVCLASMTATGVAASLIRAGELGSALVGGFESMTGAPHAIAMRTAKRVGHVPAVDLLVNDGLWCSISDSGMGQISDRANADLDISRADQDQFASESHRRAAQATEAGRFKHEATALTEVLDADEGIRAGTGTDALARLRPAFTDDGTITAGNASQMSDAAAAGLVVGRGHAARLGLTPMVAIAGRAVVAGPDVSLHLKPAAAARVLLDRHGLSVADIGLWEINEAFAGVVLASARDLHVDLERVNVNGGAIALGHPLGASGFRMLLSLACEMRLRDVEFGVAAICGGGGQGQAMLLRAV